MSDQLPPPPPAGWGAVGPYAQSSMAAPPMRSVKGLSTALVALFVLTAMAQLGAARARFSRAGLLDQVVSGSFPGVQRLNDADQAVRALSGIHLLLFLGSFVVFVVWQFRHAKNAETLGSVGGLGAPWAIGGWFVPFANWVLPTVQIFQSSRASDIEARRAGKSARGAPIVVVWGALFGLGAAAMLRAGSARSDSEGNVIVDTIADVRNLAQIDRRAGLAHVVLIAAALSAIVMVRSLTNRQRAAFENLAAAPLPRPVAAPPPPRPTPPPPGTPWPPPPGTTWPPAGSPDAPPVPPPPGAWPSAPVPPPPE